MSLLQRLSGLKEERAKADQNLRFDCVDGKSGLIISEANGRDSGFIEKLNTKLANHEGKESAQRQGPMS